VRRDTRVRIATEVSTGTPSTPVLAGTFEWDSGGLLGGPDELSGTPKNLFGLPNGQRLPAYARVDAGVRRDWHVSFAGRDATLSTYLNMQNVFNRRNVFGLLETPLGDARSNLFSPGRSLTFGLEWGF